VRVKVQVEDLQHGMFVAELDRPWLESPFLFQGFVIEEDAELDQLRTVCRWVLVEDSKSRRSIDFNQVQQASATRQATSFVTVAKATAKVAARATDQVEKLLDSARLGASIEPGDAREIVGGLVHSVASNTNAALWLTSLKKRNARTAGHCLNVSILALAFAQSLGEPLDEMEDIGTGALLHDIGQGKVPKFVVDKPGVLETAEWEIVKQHPGEGYKMMQATKLLPPRTLEIIRDHHERLDGSGYPRGIKGEQVSKRTRIVAIADIYDSLTTDQPWRRAMLPSDALTEMHKTLGEALGRELLERFIKCLGIYPIGSVVRLSTGALAVVLSSDPESRMKPMVMVVRDPDGKEVVPRSIVNLQVIARNRPTDPWLIAERVDPASCGIDVQALIEAEVGR